jgi:hypothetical protein
VPGIISLLIIEKLSFHKEYRLFQILIYSLILGFANYCFYYSILEGVNGIFHKDHPCTFFIALSDNSIKLDFGEIALVSLLALLTGYIVTALINLKILNRLGLFFRVTKKFGDLDVWSYVMNSKNTEWVVIRDQQRDLMYEGWVELFSDSTEQDELLLRDVIVFTNSTGKELYRTPGLYLPKRRENITIEFPGLKYTEFIDRPTQKERKND